MNASDLDQFINQHVRRMVEKVVPAIVNDLRPERRPLPEPDNEEAMNAGTPLPPPVPIPMLLWCPVCRERHIDRGDFVTKVHHTHACQCCGMVWRPAIVPTVGVAFLPGFKDDQS